MSTDIFCKIIAGELPAEAVYRDEHVLVIRDIHPQAPVHLLAMPIKHFESIGDAADGDESTFGHLLRVAHRVAHEHGLTDGYRLILNEGEHGGKLVPHLHLHILGGKQLGVKIVNGGE